jgi:CRISPR-associated protein Csm2
MENLDIIKPDKIIQVAETKGKEFKKIKTNQIRNFFAAVVSIKNKVEAMDEFNYSEIETELLLLQPKLAYAAGRQPVVLPFKEFVDEIIPAIHKSTDKEKAVNNFLILIESVVAYHKFYSENK